MSSTELREEDLRMDLGTLIGAVLGRWLRILLVTVLLLGATFAVLLFIPKLYESSASLLVEQRDNAFTPVGTAQPSGSSISIEALMSSQIELIKSRDLLMEVIDSENLRSLPEFSGAGFSLLNAVLQLIGRKPDARSIDETVLANLGERMTVIRERDSAVISIYVRSRDPELSARIANAAAQAHVKRRAAQSLADTADATVWLQQEIGRLRQMVKTAETAVANYRVDNDLFAGANNTPVTDQQLSTITTQIAAAQERKNNAQSRAAVIRGLLASGQSLDGVADVRDSLTIQNLSQSKAALQNELAQKSATLLNNHPTIKALKAQIKQVEGQIAIEGRRVADALDAEARIEGDLEQKLRDDLTSAKVTASSATLGGVDLDSLEREAKAQRDLLENYLAKYSDAVSSTAANSELPDVRVVSEAAPALQPASPKIPLILGAVGFVALALQIGGIVLGELLSGRALVARSDIEAADYPEEDDDIEFEDHFEPPVIEDDEPSGDEALVGDANSADDEHFEDYESAFAAALQGPEKVVPDAAAAVPPEHLAPTPDLALAGLGDDIADGKVRVLLLAALTDHADCLTVAETLIRDALARGLSAVEVDAGGGGVSALPGLTDLAAGRAEYGDVVQRIDDNIAEVPWGRLPAIDRRSLRPLTLIEALADIYHLVIVNTGRIGMNSSLPIFSGSHSSLVLVSDGIAGEPVLAAARRDAAALGFTVSCVIEAPVLQSEVA